MFCALLAAAAVAQEQDQKNDKTSPPVWTIPDINALPDDAAGRLVRHGRDLITMTDAYIGPHAADRDTRFAGSNLASGNCHLEAGTKKFGLPIFGLASDFPRYSARTGADISIEERMNGRPLPVQSPDMQALAAYVKFLSSGVVQGEQVPGHGAGTMPELDRAADPKHGKLVYTRACLDCHNTNGSGIARSPQAMSLGYAVPPLGEATVSTMAPGWRGSSRSRISFIPTCRMGPIIGIQCCQTKRPGMWRPMSNRKRGRINQDLIAISPRTCWISPLTRPTDPTPTASPKSNINTGRLSLSGRQ